MRPIARYAVTALVLALTLAPRPGAGQERAMYWTALDVNASLDSAGVLRVRERHDMVFTGDWNGGERRFNVRTGQRLRVHGVTRIDATGREIALTEGDVEAVDHFDRSGSLVRWRSRRPDDPVFENTPLTYVIEYSLDRILLPRDESFVLDHDFAFPDRPSVIARFGLHLDIAPTWTPIETLQREWSAEGLLPGQGFVVTAPLRYQGTWPPAGVRIGAAAPIRIALLLLLMVGAAIMLYALWQREKALGRFEHMPGPGEVSPAFLDEHVFSRPPEVVGALWDERTDSAEVAAVIARMVQEKKLATSMTTVGWKFLKQNVLELSLLADRRTITGYERTLVDALFESGEKTTDSARLRERYRRTGFDPAALLRPALEALTGNRTVVDPDVSAPRGVYTWLLLGAAAFLLAAAGVRDPSEVPMIAGGTAGLIVFWVVAVIGASLWRFHVRNVQASALRWVIPLLLMLAALDSQLHFNPFRAGPLVLAGLVLLALAIVRSVTNAGMSRRGASHLAQRRRLAAAREYFKQELAKDAPNLRDAWVPWLVGLGLARDMDRWFAAFGAEQVASSTRTYGSSGSRGTSFDAPSTTWSGMGGGGGFSGGGTAATFAALSSFSSGVSKPSSSSSSSGGGSSGGSSGGGGGGGW